GKGTFREDLYYRLNVISIKLPPLRDRVGDVPMLADHFLREFTNSSPNGPTDISTEAMKLLEEYVWPGNVRELQNVLSRAVTLCAGEIINPEDLPEYVRNSAKLRASSINEGVSFKESKKRWLVDFEKDYLSDLLARNGNNISRAAKEAGIDRKTIHRLLNKYKLDA
ncbi:MAG: AAA-type ATPase lid domain-containing protein, partial [Nitrospirota bacterium]